MEYRTYFVVNTVDGRKFYDPEEVRQVEFARPDYEGNNDDMSVNVELALRAGFYFAKTLGRKIDAIKVIRAMKALQNNTLINIKCITDNMREFDSFEEYMAFSGLQHWL